MRRASLVVLLSAVLLAACSQIPSDAVPEAATPDTWMEAQSGATTWPSPDWWRNFGSAQLDRLIAAAQAGNTDIAQAMARIIQADAAARAAGAALLLTVGADAAVARQWQDGGSGTQGDNNFDVGLSARYEIDVFGGNRASALAAQADAQASRYARDVTALAVTTDVATVYFQLLEARARLEVANENVAIAEDVLEIIESKQRAGAVSPLDVAQQATEVANQKATIPDLVVSVSQNEHALALLLGVLPESLGAVEGDLMAMTPPAVTLGMPSELLRRRPDIAQAEAQLIAANADIGVARAAFYPSIDLAVGYGYGSQVLSALFDPVEATSSIALGLAQTIFDGGALEAGVEQAEGRKAELVAAYRQTVIGAFGDVEDALVARYQADIREQLLEQALEQARLAYAMADSRYRAGATDLETLLDAQRSLFNAQDDVTRARASRLGASVDLYSALGGGWTTPPQEVSGEG